MDILCCGLAVADILAYYVDERALRQDSLILEDLRYEAGGDALNAAVNLAKLGIGVKLCAAVGNDASGDFLRRRAGGFGVDISGIKNISDTGTATSLVLCRHDGQRHFLYSPGVNNFFSPEMIDNGDLKSAEMLYIGSAMALPGLEGRALAGLFKKAQSYGVLTVMDCTFDSENIWYGKIKDALPFTDIFFPSLTEAERITGETEPEAMAQFMKNCGVKIFGVKLGSAGVYCTDYKDEYYLDAYYCSEKDLVDTTGAGDAFIGGFLACFVRGEGLLKSAVFGSAVSNFCIRSAGASGACFDYDTVVDFIKKQPDIRK